MQRKHLIALALVVLVLAQLACGSSNTGQKVGESTAATAAPAKIETYKIGDVIEVQEHTIILNSAAIKNGKITANFTVENKGSKDLAVSSLISFSAKADDGTKLEQDIMDCSPALDGTVLSGDKSKGNICWKGLTTDKARIYYQADLLGTGAIIWEISK